MPPPFRRLPAAALASLLLAGSALADPLITAATPGTTPGSLQVTVSGAEGTPVLFADGRPVAASVTDQDGPVTRLAVTALPDGTRWLGAADAGGAGPQVSVMLAPTAAPVADLAVYHVMLGHFANGNRSNDTEGMRGWRHPLYAGGDLQGLLDRVDHIASLGVNAVWLSPLFPAESSHGYDVKNYFQIGGARAVPGDPQASLALFRQVRDALQSRGIKVILDLPLNHGHRSYDMRDGDPKGFDPKRTGPRQEAERTWESWGSPFRYWNLDHEPTRAFLKDAALHWLVAEKVDGLRLDYVRGVDHGFWAGLYAAAKAARPDAVLIGEAWQDKGSAEANARDIALYHQPVPGQGPQFHALFDFPSQMAFTQAFGRGGGLRQVEEWLQRGDALYGAMADGQGGRPAYFLDNHDTARLAAWSGGDKARVTAAVGLLSALSGPVVLFYGTETGLSHPAPQPGFTDASRVPMPWDTLDGDMVAAVAAYLTARRDHAVLRRGARLPLLVEEEVLVMAKQDGDSVALVGVNLSATPRTLALPVGGLLPAGVSLAAAAGGADAPRVSADGTVTWTLPPVSTQIALTTRP